MVCEEDELISRESNQKAFKMSLLQAVLEGRETVTRDLLLHCLSHESETFFSLIQAKVLPVDEDLILFCHEVDARLLPELIQRGFLIINDYFIGFCFEVDVSILISLMKYIDFGLPFPQLKDREGGCLFDHEMENRVHLSEKPDLLCLMRRRPEGGSHRLLLSSRRKDEDSIYFKLKRT